MLLKSIKEEWQLLLTKKINIVVLFILPVLTMLLLGFELNAEVIADIPVAVIDLDGSGFSQQLIDAFDQNEIFNVISYPGNEAELEKLIKNSKVRMGIIIPENFYNDVAMLKSPTVLMIYDGSNMSLTGAAKAKATEILLTYKAGAAIKQLQARLNMSYDEALNVVQAFSMTSRNLYNPKKSFEDFLAPILLAGSVQGAMVLIASVSVNHEIFALRRKERIGYGLGKVIFYTCAGTLSCLVCVFIQVKCFEMSFVGNMLSVAVLSFALFFAVSSFCILISTVMRNRMVALLGGGVVFIPNSIMAGTTWPIQSMPLGYRGFAQYLPFTRFANNLRDIYLKGYGIEALTEDIQYLILFGLMSVGIAELIFVLAEVEDKEVVIRGMKTKDKETEQNELSRNLQETVPINI